MTGAITVREADEAAWEVLGPAIFHGEMTGPEAFARHAAQARLEALEEAAAFVEQRSDVHTNSRPALASAIRALAGENKL